MWTDASWHHLNAGLTLLQHRLAALQAELAMHGRHGITPEEVHQRLFASEGSVNDALDAIAAAVAWDLAEVDE
jgi:hypothetical protein